MRDKTKSLLSQLPEIKDQRSKKTVYQNVQNKMDENQSTRNKKQKKTPWIIPTIAAAVVILLAVLITPGLFNQNDDSINLAITNSDTSSNSGSNTEESSLSNDTSEDRSDEPAKSTEEKPEEEADTTNEVTETTKDEQQTITNSVTFDHYTPALQANASTESIVLAYPDQQSMLLVPLTFELDNSKSLSENIETILSTFKPGEVGLANSPLGNATFDVEITNDTKTLIANFPEAGDSLSSNESIMINDSVKILAQSLDAEQINWQTNGEDGYNLGNFGPADSSVDQKPSPYYLFETSAQNHFLVEGPELQGEEGAQLDVAMSLMKEGQPESAFYQPSIPENVSIFSFEGEEDHATISFTEGSTFQSEEEALQTIEALMLAASQYNYKTISFENSGFERVGNYSLNKEVSVPTSPNAINLN
ncbi:hypothetical protein ABFG93_08125 [Pseudalkalibacillus hwajinpoensis]|uniref:hypothetical protein n=1 Tax=Guptibacillus hwajinpoensis TaxID=208199 RepID=UPI00325B10C9